MPNLKQGLKTPVTPGYTTFVSPDSKSNLPTGNDREKEQVLPPESATHSSPSSGNGESHKDHGTSIPKFEMNTPDNDIPDRPRTLPSSGEEYGHPTKFDYGMPTRRSMTARSNARFEVYARIAQANPTIKKLRQQYPMHPCRLPSPEKVAQLYQATPSPERVAALYKEAWEVGPTFPALNREHKQYGPARLKSRLLYKRDRPTRKRKALKRYKQFCKKNQRCRKKRKLYNEMPNRFERKQGPRREKYTKEAQIHFVLDHKPCAVYALSPMRNAVVYQREDKHYFMSVPKFLRTATFMSKGDADSFFDFVDVELGPTAYREAADTFQYDQESPNAGEINHPGDDVGYAPSSAKDWVHHPDDKGGVPKGNPMPDNHGDDVPAASPRVTPNGEGKMWSGEETYLKAAATVSEILEKTSQTIQQRAKGIPVQLKRADPTRGIWVFSVQGKDKKYTVKIKGVAKGNIKQVGKAQVLVSCSCDFFRFQGPEHHAQSNGYLYGKPVGTATVPTQKDPQGKNWICKHVAAIFQTRVPKMYLASEDCLQTLLRTAEVVPEWEYTMKQVSDRYLAR